MKAQPERWRDIPGFAGYEASTEGRIRNHKGAHGSARVLTPHIDTHKGAVVNKRITILMNGTSRTFQVARLVYTAWIGPIPEGAIVCNRNGDMTDTRPSNLMLGDRGRRFSERARKIGGPNHRPVVKIDRSLEVVAAYRSAREAARLNGYRDKSNITRICNFELKSSIFAPDGHIYAWDDTRSIWAALRRGMRELDALGLRYNNPFTGRYFDLEPEPDFDIDPALWWSDAAPALAAGVPISDPCNF